MPKRARFAGLPARGGTAEAVPQAGSLAGATEAELRLLMEEIYSQYSYDFRDYAGASQKRRVLQALAQFEYPGIPELQAGILQDPELFMRLLQYLTIPVSEMFRDPTFFLALR